MKQPCPFSFESAQLGAVCQLRPFGGEGELALHLSDAGWIQNCQYWPVVHLRQENETLTVHWTGPFVESCWLRVPLRRPKNQLVFRWYL